MPSTIKLCRLCPQRLGTTPRALLIDISQRIHEHRQQPGLWPENRADHAIFAEYLATDSLCSYCIESEIDNAS